MKTNLTSTLHIDEHRAKRWFLSDRETLHREDGPAVEWWGKGYQEWQMRFLIFGMGMIWRG